MEERRPVGFVGSLGCVRSLHAQGAQALSQAAACWSLAGYQANSAVMGDRLRRAFAEFDVLTPARAVGAPGSLDFYAVAAGIIECDLARLEVLVRARRAFLDDVQSAALDGAAQADDGLAVAELVELIALGELLAGLEHALRFWRTGHPRSAARADERLAEAERLTLAGETPESWLVANSAREIFGESTRASTWRLVVLDPDGHNVEVVNHNR
jgi:hypothetical protein